MLAFGEATCPFETERTQRRDRATARGETTAAPTTTTTITTTGSLLLLPLPLLLLLLVYVDKLTSGFFRCMT